LSLEFVFEQKKMTQGSVAKKLPNGAQMTAGDIGIGKSSGG